MKIVLELIHGWCNIVLESNGNHGDERMKIREIFSTPINISTDAWVVGRLFTAEGRFLRNIMYYGSNPTEAR